VSESTHNSGHHKSSNGQERIVTFDIMRYDSAKHPKPYSQKFEVPAPTGLTVLDGLHYIKENTDSSLSWRSSCRIGRNIPGTRLNCSRSSLPQGMTGYGWRLGL